MQINQRAQTLWKTFFFLFVYLIFLQNLQNNNKKIICVILQLNIILTNLPNELNLKQS